MEDIEPTDLLSASEVDYEALSDADDDTLLRLVAAYRRDEISNTADLSAESMATLLLRNRGYDINGEDDGLEIRTPDGSRLTAADI